MAEKNALQLAMARRERAAGGSSASAPAPPAPGLSPLPLFVPVVARPAGPSPLPLFVPVAAAPAGPSFVLPSRPHPEAGGFSAATAPAPAELGSFAH